MKNAKVIQSQLIGKIINAPAEEGLLLLPDNSIDLFLTSPPYGDLRTYNGFSWDFETIAALIYKKLKTGGVLCWNIDDQTKNGKALLLPERQLIHFCDNGFILYDTIYWQKHGVPCPTPNRYYKAIERIFILSKGKPKTLNLICDRINASAGRKEITHKRQSRTHRERSNKPSYITELYGRRTNVWTYVPMPNETNHPAIMPELLAADLVKSYSNEGDWVCDPHAGSGTTCVVSEKLNRKWTAFDCSAEYVKSAQQRVKNIATIPFFNFEQPVKTLEQNTKIPFPE